MGVDGEMCLRRTLGQAVRFSALARLDSEHGDEVEEERLRGPAPEGRVRLQREDAKHRRGAEADEDPPLRAGSGTKGIAWARQGQIGRRGCGLRSPRSAARSVREDWCARAVTVPCASAF